MLLPVTRGRLVACASSALHDRVPGGARSLSMEQRDTVERLQSRRCQTTGRRRKATVKAEGREGERSE